MPRERIFCKNERKFKKYRQIKTIWEFEPGHAYRMRYCTSCGVLIQETEYKL